ncbi:hypothetical protein GALMADRAFT_1052938 [Galerina marginata CBS 339.88]|uniref:Uncharacterized protein n=1 Tax=Galerina marginata (strain CBS 339.88) TaxID=685588 RepID=A0A067SB66_GALM3|nr:hypothetical protein GALMADRAFT_1052938 [Galerina marginata CBS 339.88]
MFHLQMAIPLVPDVSHWLKTTLYCYIGPPVVREYQNILVEFLEDPIRAGEYGLNGEKVATLAEILLYYLVQPAGVDDLERIDKPAAYEILSAVEDLMPQAAYSWGLVELLNNAEVVFPNTCCMQRYSNGIRNFQTTAQILGKYLARVCGSVPREFRIMVEEQDGGENTSYYYNGDGE